MRTKMMTKSLTKTIEVLLAVGSTLIPVSWAADAPLAADSYISSASPNSNFGSVETLAVSTGKTALVRFDLSSIPSCSNIAKAYLRVFVDKVTTPGTLNYALVTSSWTENG